MLLAQLRGAGAVIACALAGSLAGCGSGQAGPSTGAPSLTLPTASVSTATTSTATATTTRRTRRPVLAPRRPPVIVERVLGLVDHSRTMRFPGQPRQPRALTTIVRYPSPAAGPLPLIVFGHGFAVTPRPYAALLEAWARAGYVVAAPVFPLENGDAPGGPNEADLVNQPRDMSFVITSLLQASAGGSGPLRGRIDPGRSRSAASPTAARRRSPSRMTNGSWTCGWTPRWSSPERGFRRSETSRFPSAPRPCWPPRARRTRSTPRASPTRSSMARPGRSSCSTCSGRPTFPLHGRAAAARDRRARHDRVPGSLPEEGSRRPGRDAPRRRKAGARLDRRVSLGDAAISARFRAPRR